MSLSSCDSPLSPTLEPSSLLSDTVTATSKTVTVTSGAEGPLASTTAAALLLSTPVAPKPRLKAVWRSGIF